MIRVRAADAARAGLLASGAAPAVGASEDDARAVSTGERLLVTALVYPGLPQCPVDPRTTATIAPRVVRLPNLRPSPDQPLGLDGALVERDPGTGVLRGVPMGDAVLAGDPETGFHFPYRPRNGGVRPRDNERAGGAENERALEGSRFGEVNAYYHADRTLAYANGLLAELGEPPLPRLRVVVDSHPCSHLPGHGQGDCDRRGRKAISYGGGHYRRPDKRDRDPCFNHRPTGMNPTGEVHLGPGNGATKDADGNVLLVHGAPYTRKPSHNAGIITHEVGHHIVSHITDFRCNRDRPPDKTSHRKIHLDEGFCDYWSAVMLDTPDIFAWHRAGERPADRGNRDLSGPRTTADFVLGGGSPREWQHLEFGAVGSARRTGGWSAGRSAGDANAGAVRADWSRQSDAGPRDPRAQDGAEGRIARWSGTVARGG